VMQALDQVEGLDHTHVRKVGPVLSLLKKCLCVSSFHFTDPELWQADRVAHMCEEMRLCCIY